MLAAVGLTDRADDRAGTFSGGMKRRLNLAVAVVHRPQLLLLDEPTTGVDPQSRNHIFERVKALNAAGLTVVYTSHYMEEVQTLCTRIAILDGGELRACDTLPNLLRRFDAVARVRLPTVPPGLVERVAAAAGGEAGRKPPTGAWKSSPRTSPRCCRSCSPPAPSSAPSRPPSTWTSRRWSGSSSTSPAADCGIDSCPSSPSPARTSACCSATRGRR